MKRVVYLTWSVLLAGVLAACSGNKGTVEANVFGEDSDSMKYAKGFTVHTLDNGVRLVVVNHLNELTDDGTPTNAHRIEANLKSIAEELGITIIAVQD
jgi:hypothetical protein